MSITDRARLCVVLVVGAGLLVAACGGGSSTDACGLSNSAAATNAAAPATAAASGSWSYANADLDNTRDARGSTISSANLSGLAQAWTFKLTGRAAAGLRPYGSLAANPIVQDGVVYFQDLDSNVYALALATGKLRWYYQGVPDDFKDYDMQTSPISANINGVSVVIGSGKMGYVYEMNAETGQLIWKTPVGEHNGHDDDSLHALEHTSTLKAPLTILPGSLGGVLTNLALAGGTLYAVTCDLPLTYTSLNEPTPTKAAGPATGEVAALNLATGKVEWDTKVPQRRDRLSPPAAHLDQRGDRDRRQHRDRTRRRCHHKYGRRRSAGGGVHSRAVADLWSLDDGVASRCAWPVAAVHRVMLVA